jgi:hypothetical protein
MSMSPEERGKKGFAALAAKYGHGKAAYIVRMAKNDALRRQNNTVLSVTQTKRETVRGWEAQAKDYFGIAY